MCFDFVAGMLLILATLPLALFVFVRIVLPLLVDFSLRSLKSMSIEVDGSCFDDDVSGASAAADDDDADDGCGKDSAFDSIGVDRNVSKQTSAHSNAVIKQCPSIRNCNVKKERKKTKLKLDKSRQDKNL